MMTMENLMDGEFDKHHSKGYAVVRACDMQRIWANSDLKEVIDNLKHSFNTAQLAKSGGAPLEPAVDALALVPQDTEKAADSALAGNGAEVDESELIERSDPQKFLGKAATVRTETQCLLQAGLNATSEELVKTVGSNPLFSTFGGQWRTLHRLLVVDVNHLCEGPAPWKKHCAPRHWREMLRQRVKAMILLSGQTDICAIFCGHAECNLEVVETIIRKLMDEDHNISPMSKGIHQKKLTLLYDEKAVRLLAGQGLGGAADIENCILLAKSYFFLLKKKQWTDMAGSSKVISTGSRG